MLAVMVVVINEGRDSPFWVTWERVVARSRLPARDLDAGRHHRTQTSVGGPTLPSRAPSHGRGSRDPARALDPEVPACDLFNARGRTWLARQPLPDDERSAIDRHVRELDRLADDLDVLDREMAQGPSTTWQSSG